MCLGVSRQPQQLPKHRDTVPLREARVHVEFLILREAALPEMLNLLDFVNILELYMDYIIIYNSYISTSYNVLFMKHGSLYKLRCFIEALEIVS